MLTYRIKVKLADVGEEFANLCHADGFGCCQFIESKKVEITYYPGCVIEERAYLERRKNRTNTFIERLLLG